MNKRSHFKKVILLLVGFLVFSLVAGFGVAQAQEQEGDTLAEDQRESETSQTIYELIQAEPSLSNFEALVEAVALNDNLQQDGPFTVFAPTNEALAAFNAMTEDESVTDTMLYHVLNGDYTSADLAENWGIMTLADEYLFFDASVEGENTSIVLNETVNVTGADIHASNGVIHIIDAVVPLPEGNSLFASDLGSPQMSLAEVLANDSRFETFLSLAEQAGLMDELENTTSTYTLFVPTDEAFEQVPEALMEDWLAAPEETLNAILSYHIVGDRLSINQIANDDYIPTLNGRALIVSTDEDIQVYVNGRAVQQFNMLASNGVLHVVDEIILP